VLLGIGLGYVAQCSMRDLGWIGKGDVLLFDHLFYYDPLKKILFYYEKPSGFYISLGVPGQQKIFFLSGVEK
jgi:hypothetical protein